MKRFSAWSNRNPLAAVILGLLACFALMLIAQQWDRADDVVVRVQQMRGST